MKSTKEIVQERTEESARIRAELEANGYQYEDATVSMLKANIMVFLLSIPICAVVVWAYGGQHSILKAIETIRHNQLFVIAVLILSVPVHECLHGLGWYSFCKRKWKSICFGFALRTLTPYCHCREALTVKQYYAGLLLPVTVLGMIPAALAVLTGGPTVFFIALYNILLAGGDLAIALLILKYFKVRARLLDHPTECGCYAFVRPQETAE